MGCLRYRPNVCTMTTVNKSMCRLEKVNLGFLVLATLYRHALQPDAYRLNTLIHGMCTEGFMIVATEKKHPYLGLIDSLCKGGGMDEALSFSQDMINLGVVYPWIMDYANLVVGARFLIDMLDARISLSGSND
ncbi:Pentatricopeptide repeat [Trema orientale]|uniref:Pentatricopeptide repeat n=1 Tax=Trema orientale TaxID=63057 RepID=A0A2P5FR71_TREOI|nr:Pentatricopeptide repeat [Trema orientale]